MSFYSKNLRDDEQVITILRRHWLSNLPKYILAFILFFIPFFFMFPLLDQGTWGQILFAVLLAVAVFYLLKLISFSYFNCLLVTTQRLIDFSQKKSLERQVKETEFLDIAEVAYKVKGLLQMISKSGNLEIKLVTSQYQPAFIIRSIYEPEKVQNLILDLKKLAAEEAGIKQQQTQTGETYHDLLKKMQQDIGEEGLKRLVQSLDKDEDGNEREDL